MGNLILVTDWEKVEKDNYYLTKDWAQKTGIDAQTHRKARQLAKNGELYYAYIANAVDYVVCSELDAHEVFINYNRDILVECEGTVIGNEHKYRYEYLF